VITKNDSFENFDKNNDNSMMTMIQPTTTLNKDFILRDPNNSNVSYFILHENINKQKFIHKNNTSNFVGVCFKCGEWGHRGFECRNKKNIDVGSTTV
jgi:hypothetical protein